LLAIVGRNITFRKGSTASGGPRNRKKRKNYVLRRDTVNWGENRKRDAATGF